MRLGREQARERKGERARECVRESDGGRGRFECGICPEVCRGWEVGGEGVEGLEPRYCRG